MKQQANMIECPVCLAQRDASSSHCWRCGFHGGGVEFAEGSRGVDQIPNPYEAEPSEMQKVGKNFLVITLALVILGASSVVPGLMFVLVIVAIILYLVNMFSTVSKNDSSIAKNSGTQGDQKNSKATPQQVQMQPVRKPPVSGVDILVRALAAAILLPIVVVVGLAIICGGFLTVISIPQAGPDQGGFLFAGVGMLVVAVLLFIVLGKAFLSIFR